MSAGATSIGERAAEAFGDALGAAAANGPRIAAGVAVFLLTLWFARLARSGVRRVLARRSTQGNVDVLVARLVQAVVAIAGGVVALGVAGIDMTALLASLGILGVTAGLALKDVVSNYVAGIMLLVHRPFSVGDTIVVDGYEGEVIDVYARATVLRCLDGRMAYIPNATVFAMSVVNVTEDPVRRFEVRVTAPIDGDLGPALVRAADAGAGAPGVLTDPPVEASVELVNRGTARILVTGWVDTRSTALPTVRDAAWAAVARSLEG